MLRYLKTTQEHVQHTQVEVNAIIKASYEENVGQLAECSAKRVDLLVQHNVRCLRESGTKLRAD
jgi:anti-sigma factor ChrR (cupin superfamily)